MPQPHLKSVDWKWSGLNRLCATDQTWLQDLLMRCKADTSVFSKAFMPDAFDGPDTWQRKLNFQTLNDPTIAYGFVIGYRAFAKTTQLKAQITKETVFRESPFTLFCSRTLAFATWQTNGIKSLILTNPYIREVFGKLKPEAYQGDNPVFSSDAFFFSDPHTNEPFCFISPKGANQQVNGALIYMAATGKEERPSRLCFDDGEDREEILSEDNRKKYRSWFWNAVLPCVCDQRPDPKTHRWTRPLNDPHWRPPFRVWQQDTVKHEDSNAIYVMESPQFIGHVFPKAEEIREGEKIVGYKSLVPEIVTDEQVTEDAFAAEARGDLDGWYMEYMCQSQSTKGAKWTKQLFKYFTSGMEVDLIKHIPQDDRFIIVDPAKTVHMESCDTAIVAVAIDVWKQRVYIRRVIADRINWNLIPRFAVDLAIETCTANVAIEITGSEETSPHGFINYVEMQKLQNYINLIWIDARQSVPKGEYGDQKNAAKANRASYLLPMYQNGFVYHHESLKGGVLEKQMLSYPKSARWDVLDAAAYTVWMMQRGGKYFQPIEARIELPKDFEHSQQDERWDKFIKEGRFRIA